MRKILLFSIAILIFTSAHSAFGQGVYLRAVTPVGEGMAGVGIANPIDSGTSIYANPASISAFKKSEMSFGLALIMPETYVGSSDDNKTRSTVGSLPSPAMSMIWKRPNSRLTLGFGVAGVGGAASLYKADPNGSNPLLKNTLHTSNVQIIQVLPTASYCITKKLSVGFSPTLSMGKLEINPSGIAFHYPNPQENVGTRYIFGGGLNMGVYYDTQCNWKFGATLKSPTWIENVPVYDGTGDSHYLDLDMPLVAGIGVSYNGIHRTILAMDIKYIDYANTNGFRDAGYNAQGVLQGLGWRSVMAVSLAVQYQLFDRIAVRAGYCFNENPVKDSSSAYNITSPMTSMHSLHVGATYLFAADWDMTLAYGHAFQKSIEGPNPNPLVSETVYNSGGGDTIAAGVTKRF